MSTNSSNKQTDLNKIVKICCIVIAAILAVTIIIILFDNSESGKSASYDYISVDIGDETFTVSGPDGYSFTLAYTDITDIDVVEDDYEIGSPVIGEETDDCYLGRFIDSEYVESYVYVVKGISEEVILTTDEYTYVFNAVDNDTTDEYYMQIKDKIHEVNSTTIELD